MSANGFLVGLLRRDAEEDDCSGTSYPGEEIETTERGSAIEAAR